MARNLTDTYATRAAAPTQSDTVNEETPGFLYVGGAGNIKVTTLDGDDVVFNALAVGIVHLILVKRVWSTGTTASNILLVR
tara:strand:+ start:9172 stop:9414 length:243 start_codon:yes stop_codon:yes gene_type:complete